jgi:predicted phosphodiesterase
MELNDIVRETASTCGPPQGIRILHMTDHHIRRSAFRLERLLSRQLHVDVVVNGGDVCGIGGPIERFIIRRLFHPVSPTIFTPGNHDSKTTIAEMRRKGAIVLDEPGIVKVGRARFWGYRDPNHSKLLFGARYQSARCRAAANRLAPALEKETRPFIAAVHHESMVPIPTPRSCPLILCGHFHSARIRRSRHTLIVRTASAGGRNGHFGKALRFTVVDVEPETLRPLALMTVEAEGNDFRLDRHKV